MKHLWDRPIDCAQPDGSVRTCRQCGAKVRRHKFKATLTLPRPSGPWLSKDVSIQVWSYKRPKEPGPPTFRPWVYLWELPRCDGAALPRCSATRRVRGQVSRRLFPVQCRLRSHDRQMKHTWTGVPGGGDGEMRSVEW